MFTFFAGEAGTPKLLLPVVEQQRGALAARRLLDPLAVIIEVIFSPAHQEDVITTSEVQQRVNALLRARGETLEYSAKEIGWKLSDLGLQRQRNAKGTFLKFTLELRTRIHGLAEQFQLSLPRVNGCRMCAPVQLIEP